MTEAEVEAFFQRLAALRPAPETELRSTSPYTLLVAVILSAQATDVGVNKATERLFKVADTPEKMLALGEDGLIEHIKTIGLFRNKARAVIAMSRQLLERHDGTVPDDREANVVLNAAFGQPTIAVDTHVLRVANRTGLAPGRTPLEVEQALERVVPAAYRRHAHHWLILHGRYVCLARKPKCAECPVRDLCSYQAKTG
jgi:endonuclease-3